MDYVRSYFSLRRRAQAAYSRWKRLWVRQFATLRAPSPRLVRLQQRAYRAYRILVNRATQVRHQGLAL